MFYLRRLMLAVIVSISFKVTLAGEEFKIKINSSPQKLEIENTGKTESPIIQIIGVTDKLGKCTLNPSINETQLANKLLTGSVLTINSNSTGSWEYDAGFRVYPTEILKKEQPEHWKYKYDISGKEYKIMAPECFLRYSTKLVAMARRLQLADKGKPRPAIYKIEFPAVIKIEELQIRFTPSNTAKVDDKYPEVHVGLYKDALCKETIIEHIGSMEKGAESLLRQKNPLVFKDISRNSVYLKFSSNGVGSINIFSIHLKALLNTSKVNLPVLKNGLNVFKYSDSQDSSHRAKVKISWDAKPLDAYILTDFNNKDTWTVKLNETEIKMVKDNPYTKGICGELTFKIPATVEKSVSLPVKRKMDNADWSKYEKIVLFVRCDSSSHGSILMGFYDLESKKMNTCLILRANKKTNGWEKVTWDISKYPRKKIDRFQIYTVNTWNGWYPGQVFKIYLNTLSLISSYKPVFTEKMKIPNIKKWFPLGVTFYPGSIKSQAKAFGYKENNWWRFMEKCLDDVKARNINTIFMGNFGNLEEASRLIDLCEKKKIRVYLQGSSNWFYSRRKNRESRIAFFKKIIKPYATKHMPLYKDRWGLLCWGLTEEIKPDVADDVKEYYQLVKELTPKHPGLIICNTVESGRKVVEIIKPKIMVCDRYPYNHGLSNEKSLELYETFIDSFYQFSRNCDANLWVMFQGFKGYFLNEWGEEVNWNRRYPSASEMKLQAWLAVAHGAKGLFCFNYISRQRCAPGIKIMHGLRGSGWKDTEQFIALGEVYGEIKVYIDLLLNLLKEKNVSAKIDNPMVELHQFKEDKFNRTYLIVVNINTLSEESFFLSLRDKKRGTIYDLSTGNIISDNSQKQSLLPGTGRIYLIGTEKDYNDYCQKYNN